MVTPPLSPEPARRRNPVTTGVLVGLLAGLATGVALVVIPGLLNGGDFYESTDPLLVFCLTLGPLGAGIGLVVGTVMAARAADSPIRMSFALIMFLVIFLGVWKFWSVMTGTQGPF